ncbi:MAG: ACP S-malonyltransferase, partial [Oscillospiraceae bacterium]
FAECLSHNDAFNLVCKRAEFMNDAAQQNKGVMIAVLGLPAVKIKEICNLFDGAFPVNFNCPTQTAVACSEALLEALTSELMKHGAKVIKLAVSGAFHSPYMNIATLKMREFIKQITFTPPKIPVFSNATAQPYSDKSLIAKQINSPVLWQDTVENMIALGVDTFIEVGAGKTLCNLIRKINPHVAVYNVEDKNSLKNVLEELGKC